MPAADVPPYLRIAADLRGRIAAGALRPGDRVPSTRGITQEWGVAMATATKVLAVLRQEGLVESRPGVGTVVAEGADGDGGPGAPVPPVTEPAEPAPAAAPAPAPARARRREPRAGDPGLNRERIVQAAIAVADAEGLAPLSMRRVAAELGVATMALYRHVPSKEELVDLMADAVLLSTPLPAATLTGWRPRLAALARVQWSLYRRHPWLARSISLTRPVPLPGALRHGEFVLDTVAPFELPPTTQLYLHIMFFAVIRGIAVNLELQSQEGEMTDEEWMASQEGVLLSTLASGEFPRFGSLMGQLDSATGEEDFDLDLDQLFEFVLARLLDGLTLLFEPPAG
ncbi:TetR/AcrR family transcriptional regulator C-terminal domain-containing protein [Kitasatospora sp. NBC_01287]|uniref:GntR family transcriptional regulator n=1 Tax=Kitasatospora sp. NBC_01287 TaxID=2903573 RepID=UPI0022538BE1|nr:GntR family transcriptional regulator [Kitasatospora sp. NBC_01287]MCX4749355.1 TetR/AcrR family transcriptional regulator C-terminal domain-containing protein [Kitasatospora sp. NBC_01287]